VHVPVASASDPLAMSMQLTEASAIRSGEEVLAMRGETLAIDGVVQAGDAKVLAYPTATAPLRRKVGDAILAGATVLDGALRVLATRVGDERSMVRLTRFGSHKERDPALLSRVSQLVERFGGFGTLGLSATALLLAKTGGPAVPLAAASAVLLSAPLLSLRRAAEAPLRAAAAAAGARGIVFQSASALDATGRATVVAMSPYGVLTEAQPVVVELHVLDDSDRDQLIAMAAAAERAAPGHAIANAIEHFARERRLPALEVRRPVHHPGKGVTAISPQGQPLVVGSRRLLLEEGISVAVADAEAARAEAAERAPLFIAIDGRVRAILTLQYELRVGARAAVQRMVDLGLEVVLLTGEQRGAVQVFARGLDIEHVKSELLPEDRGLEVGKLREAGGTVAALGRPGEDDAALGAADAGIVLTAAGGSATERAVALVSDDVRDAAAALWIAQAARDSAWRAVGVAAVAFALVVAAASAGLIVPGIAALLTAAVDTYCLPAGARLLRRIALRLPARS
jgi:P-type E1-E2 ATPase